MMNLKIGLVIGVLFRSRKEGTADGLVIPEIAVTYGTLIHPMNTNVAWAPSKGQQRDKARNGIAEEAVKIGAKYLLFLDDDVQPPPDVTRLLMDTLAQADDDVMVAAGIYTGKLDPPEPLVYVGGNGHGSHWKWKKGDIFECSSIATGCMMIKTEVFQHLEKPWFRDVDGDTEGWTIENKAVGARLNMTDDLWFCEKVTAAGFKILADARVLCAHWDVHSGRVFELPPNSYPMRPREEEHPYRVAEREMGLPVGDIR